MKGRDPVFNLPCCTAALMIHALSMALLARVERVWPRPLARHGAARCKWSSARGPLEATMTGLREVGWSALSPRHWRTAAGAQVGWSPHSAVGDPPHSAAGDMLEYIAHAFRTKQLAEADGRPHGAGLGHGFAAKHTVRIVDKLRMKHKHDQAKLLETAAMGGLCPESRRWEAGYRMHGTCARCNAADATLMHILWHCPALSGLGGVQRVATRRRRCAGWAAWRGCRKASHCGRLRCDRGSHHVLRMTGRPRGSPRR